MKVKSLLLMAVVAAMGLVSCSKDENGAEIQTDNMPKSVTITLPNIQKVVDSRATGFGIANETKLALKNFKIFFLDAAGVEVDVPQYDADGNGTDEDQQVYFSDVTVAPTEAITYHFLPAATEKVVVIGNVEDKTYTELKDLELEVPNDGVDHPTYPLYGEAGLVEKTQAPIKDEDDHENVYTATVNLAPRVSRLEVYGFEYKQQQTTTTPEFTSVELQKIALNNYHTTYEFVNAVPTGTGVFETITPSNAWTWIENCPETWSDRFAVGTPAQPLTLKIGETAKFPEGTPIRDDFDAAEDATDVKIFTYGLTANTYKTGEGDAAQPDMTKNPQLLLALHGVKTVDNATVKEPLYLHAKFEKENNPVFGAGKIYRVLFSFDDGDLKEPQRCVELKVEVANWEIVAVTPEF